MWKNAYAINEMLNNPTVIRTKSRHPEMKGVKYGDQLMSITFNDEFKRIIIHGLLHVIGYNDDTQGKKKIMTSFENKYMLLIDDEIIELKC